MTIDLLALIGYGGFLLAAFGWRTVQAKVTKGESLWRTPVSRMDALGETVCVIGCVLSLAAPALSMGGLVDPLSIGVGAVRGCVTVLALVFGTVIALRAQDHLADEWRVGVEASQALVTTGPFARVRNPFYLGCFVASAGVLVAVPSVVAIGGLILHIAAAEVIVRWVEEPMLFLVHGDRYARYKERTGRFLPRMD